MATDDFAPAQGLDRRDTYLDTKDTPQVIERFVKDYVLDHFSFTAQRAMELIEEELVNATASDGQPVLAKLSCRAKTKKSLREKLKTRNHTREKKGEKTYSSDVDDIWNDIHDLAGVRVLLYTPSPEQHKSLTDIIQKIWGDDIVPRLQPEPSDLSKGALNAGSRDEHDATSDAKATHQPATKEYIPRHPGYKGIHYRVLMKEEQQGQTSAGKYVWNERDRVEIQVVSALGHVWAEVEHDVQYKTHAYGPPTEDERRLLDTLSGLLSAGELVLEQFSKLVNKRTYAKIPHRDDFGTFLRGLDVLQKSPADVSDIRGASYSSGFATEGIDILFRYLVKSKKNNPLAVRNAFKALRYPDDHEPVLREIKAFYKPTLNLPEAFLPPFCLISSMLRGDQSLIDIAPERGSYLLSKKCRILINALTLLQAFAGSPEEAKEWLRIEIEPLLDQSKRESLNFVLSNSRRKRCLTDDTAEVQRRLGGNVLPAWEWFEKQASNRASVCGLLFQLAEMEATKDGDANTLLGGLGIGSLSRSSTVDQD